MSADPTGRAETARRAATDRRREIPRDPLVRLLLLLYPRRLRRRFGGEMWALQLRLHPDAGRFRLYRRFAADALRDGLGARLEGDPARAAAARPAHRPTRKAPMVRPHTTRPRITRRLALGLDRFAQDVRLALRSLARRPGFAAVVVLTLALALGANVALYSLVDGVLLRPLGYAEPDRLVQLLGVQAGRDEQSGTIAFLDFVDWVERTDVFSAAAAYDEWQPNLTTGASPRRLSAALVNASFFDVLGVEPAAGRFFLPEEDVDGDDRVVVLSHQLWRRHFGGDPEVVGREVELDGRLHRVVGVAPADFEDPELSGASFGPVELWRPLGYEGVAAERLPNRGSSSYTAIARLAPGVDAVAAEERLAAVTADLERLHPETNRGRGVRLVPLEEHLVGDVRGTLGLLMGAVAFVLLIAVANVANLLVGRAAERRREAAVRAALGAGRGRLLRTLLTEALLLAAAGGLLGGGAALLAVRAFAATAGDLLPRGLPPSPSPGVLAFAAGLTLATGLACGLLPALFLARGDLQAPLRGERTASSRETTRLRAALVMAEVAVSITLLVGAGLLLESFWRLSTVDPGIDPGGVLSFEISLPSSDYPEDAGVEAFYADLLQRLDALPGVESVATTSLLPLSGGFDCNTAYAAERPAPPPGEGLCAETRTVAPSYFRTLGLRLLAGRELAARDRDGAPRTVVVTRALAEELWPGGEAVGRRLVAHDVEMRVVGVVADVKHLRLDQPAPPRLYMSRAQSPAGWQLRRSTVVLGTAGEPAALLPAVRRTVWSLDDALPLSREVTLERVVADTLTTERLRTVLLTAFAAVAAVLAALGLYGVLAYLVVQRRFEVAVRMALGAGRGAVVRRVAGQGLALVLAGVGIGLAAAAGLAGTLSGFLYRVRPGEPVTFTAVALLMLLVGAAACWWPARRAAAVDPARILRQG